MQILAISDTHNQHKQIDLAQFENIDVLIHAGDITIKGTKNEVVDFLTWYDGIKVNHKLLIAGNHDFYFENTPTEELNGLLSEYPSITYLNDSGVIIEGINFWGGPVQPWFYNWAFNRRDYEIKKHWDLIPNTTNILITHGPAKGILDKTKYDENVGCPFLMETINKLTDIKLFVSGHIHEAYGFEKHGNTMFVNASLLDLKYKLINTPIKIVI